MSGIKTTTAAKSSADLAGTSKIIQLLYRLAKLVKLDSLPISRQAVFIMALVCANIGISFTGSIVRVTGSGLGCPTWPECQPGSLVPESGARPWVHQAIEWGNRMLTFVLMAFAVVAFLAVVGALRRRELIILGLIQGLGIIAQAVIGGVTVWLSLAWYMVALHFLPSMLMVWLSAVFWIRSKDPDDGHVVDVYPKPLRILALLSALTMVLTLVSGTMVTGAGPHAGDSEILPEDRLTILPLEELAHLHAHFMYLYLGLTAGLLFALFAIKAPKNVRTTCIWTVIAILGQAGVGLFQYWTGVPRWTVPFHVIGSGIVVAVTGVLWAQGRRRIDGMALPTGSPRTSNVTSND